MQSGDELNRNDRRPGTRRLLLVLPFLHFGVGRLAADLAAAAVRDGWSIDVLTCGGVADAGDDDPRLAAEVRNLGGMLHRADVFSRRPEDMQAASGRVGAICEQRGIAFVHAFTAPAAAAALGHRPVIASVVGWSPDKATWQRAMDAALLERCTMVTTVSDAMYAELHAAGLTRRDVRLIRNGVALEPSRDLECVDTTVPLRRIGVMAQLVPRKGVDIVLRALARVNALLWQELTIAGTGADANELQSLSADLLPGRRVAWVGNVPVHAWLERVDVVVVPSRSDALPLVLLQAMAYGRPVIASAIGGIPEAASHPDEVLLFEAGDARGLADALAQTLADPAAALRRCRAARRRIERDFSLAATAARYLHCYTELPYATAPAS
jgi:glycosyltransferase involved in cell wall biosynthesis